MTTIQAQARANPGSVLENYECKGPFVGDYAMGYERHGCQDEPFVAAGSNTAKDLTAIDTLKLIDNFTLTQTDKGPQTQPQNGPEDAENSPEMALNSDKMETIQQKSRLKSL